MNEKGHILVNLERFRDETPLNSVQLESVWSVKMSRKKVSGHCVPASLATGV